LFHNSFSYLLVIKEKIATFERLKLEDGAAEKGEEKTEKAEKTVKEVKENRSQSYLQVTGDKI